QSLARCRPDLVAGSGVGARQSERFGGSGANARWRGTDGAQSERIGPGATGTGDFLRWRGLANADDARKRRARSGVFLSFADPRRVRRLSPELHLGADANLPCDVQ